MDMHTWWLFVMMTFVVSATPGPNMLLVMSHSARHGFRAAIGTVCGCMTALLAMMSLSAAGLGALLQAFPTVFDTLRWIGAAYLAYLGFKSWRAPVQEESAAAAAEVQVKPASALQLYRQGFLVAASNPKAILFAAAFFPQFITAERPQLPQFAILLATFSVIEVGWYMVYGGSGHRLAAYLRRAPVLKTFNRLTGGAFIGFAAVMAASRH
ncbi:LysE family translocator [Noviherbaspirillum denitrificans]|uniref:Amino acid transporter n=1 Tax=Noviherbaspirillum denitrificans TaxID=1968433 RepID=A0A254TLP3_9BURK|nr:LysE family translocator [Noviherbaspirillum denitrificans]OWW20628.1 amino acid transporter [Noviherbaspirillum denitrificans]